MLYIDVKARMPWIRLIMLGLTVGGLLSCSSSDVPEVRLGKGERVAVISSARQKPGIRIGMGAMITPKEGYAYYFRLKEYLAKRLGMPVTLVDRGNYEEMNKLLEGGGVDVAFVCAGPYVEGNRQFGLELLAMPLVKGKPVYYSFIIVPKESPVQRLEELRGKSFAFTDPKSNSGKLVPTYLLARRNTSPEAFFGRISYTFGHDKSIAAVAESLVDGAAVDSLIWEYLNRTRPALTGRTRIIDVSEAYGIPPVVVRKDLPAALKQQIRSLLLAMHNDPEGREILDGMMTDRFVPGDDANYDSIRSMDRWLSGRNSWKRK